MAHTIQLAVYTEDVSSMPVAIVFGFNIVSQLLDKLSNSFSEITAYPSPTADMVTISSKQNMVSVIPYNLKR